MVIGMTTREGVICSSCLKTDFKESRFKCLICSSCDLCLACYSRQIESATHKKCHSMQCIPTKNELKIFFGGQSQIPIAAQSFVCPFCPKMGFTPIQLADHVNGQHLDKISERVFCPICVTLFAEVDSMVFDLGHHISIHHQQPAFESHEDLSTRKMRRIQNTVREIAAVGAARVRVNAHFMHITDSKETNDPLSELLSQLSVSRSRTLGSSASGITPQHFQINLFPTRFHNFESPRESLYVPPFSPTSTTLDSNNPLMAQGRNASISSSSSSGLEDSKKKISTYIIKAKADRHEDNFVLQDLQKCKNRDLDAFAFGDAVPLYIQELFLLSILQPN